MEITQQTEEKERKKLFTKQRKSIKWQHKWIKIQNTDSKVVSQYNEVNQHGELRIKMLKIIRNYFTYPKLTIVNNAEICKYTREDIIFILFSWSVQKMVVLSSETRFLSICPPINQNKVNWWKNQRYLYDIFKVKSVPSGSYLIT